MRSKIESSQVYRVVNLNWRNFGGLFVTAGMRSSSITGSHFSFLMKLVMANNHALFSKLKRKSASIQCCVRRRPIIYEDLLFNPESTIYITSVFHVASEKFEESFSEANQKSLNSVYTERARRLIIMAQTKCHSRCT